MGWRTDARESLHRCARQADAARADAQEARALAEVLPLGVDRDAVLQAARGMDDAADIFDTTARQLRTTLGSET